MSTLLTTEYTAFDFESSELNGFTFDQTRLREVGYIIASHIESELDIIEYRPHASLKHFDMKLDGNTITYQFDFTREIEDIELKAIDTNDFTTFVFNAVDNESDFSTEVEFTLDSFYRG